MKKYLIIFLTLTLVIDNYKLWFILYLCIIFQNILPNFMSPAAAKKVVSLFLQYFLCCHNYFCVVPAKTVVTAFYCIERLWLSYATISLAGTTQKSYTTWEKKNLRKQRYDLLRCGGRFYYNSNGNLNFR